MSDRLSLKSHKLSLMPYGLSLMSRKQGFKSYGISLKSYRLSLISRSQNLKSYRQSHIQFKSKKSTKPNIQTNN